MFKLFAKIRPDFWFLSALAILVVAVSGCSRKASVEIASGETLERPAVPGPVLQSLPRFPDVRPPTSSLNLDALIKKGAPSHPPLIGKLDDMQSRSTVGPVFDVVAERIESALAGLEPRSPTAAHKVAELWNASVVNLSSQSVGNGDIEVNGGTKLPAEIGDLRKLTDKQIEAYMVNGALPFAQTSEEFEAAVSRLLLSTASANSGLGTLPSLLTSRANNLPPTKEDLLNFFAVGQGLRELRSLSLGASTLEEWKPLSTARNPVYRLLALMAAQNATTPATLFTSSETQDYAQAVLPARLAFYRDYLNEKDPVILTAALQAIGNLSLREAKDLLEEFRSRQIKKGNTELTKLSEAAIRSCEANLRWSSNR